MLFEARWESEKPVRMLTVTALSLSKADSPTQLSLFDEEQKCEKHEKVDAAIDALKQKFGSGAVFRAGNMFSEKKKNSGE